MTGRTHLTPERWLILSRDVYDSIASEPASPNGLLKLRLELNLIEQADFESLRTRLGQLLARGARTVHLVVDALDAEIMEKLRALASRRLEVRIHSWWESPSDVLMALTAPDFGLVQTLREPGTRRVLDVTDADPDPSAALNRYKSALADWERDAREEYGEEFDEVYSATPIAWDEFVGLPAPSAGARLLGWMQESLILLWHILMSGGRGVEQGLARFRAVPQPVAAPGMWQPITRQAATHAFVGWPALTMLAAVALVLPFAGRAGGDAILWSAASATLLALAGGLVCGPVVSLLGAGAGGVGIGIAFAVIHAFILSVLGGGLDGLARGAGDAEPRVLIVYGVIGSVAPQLGQLPVGYGLVVLLVPALAIVASAFLMGVPEADRNRGETARTTLKWGLIGSGAGAAIPAVEGLAHVLQSAGTSAEAAFALAAVLVGGVCYGLAVGLRTACGRRAVLYGVAYGLIGGIIWTTALGWRGTLPGLYVSGAGTAFFHAGFFTLSYVVGLRFGGPRAAFLAASLEGVIGFVVFNALLIWRGSA